jgi:hypothetical protein
LKLSIEIDRRRELLSVKVTGNLLSGEENNNGAVFSETALNSKSSVRLVLANRSSVGLSYLLNNVSVDQQDLAVLRENLGLSSGATSCPEANFCKPFGAHDLTHESK